MKRYMKPTETVNDIHPAFYDIERQASNEGYKMYVDDNFNITFSHKDPLMPKITVETGTMGSEYFFTPSMSFNDLKYDDNMFHDTFIYYTKRYVKVAKFLEDLVLVELDPSKYMDEE